MRTYLALATAAATLIACTGDKAKNSAADSLSAAPASTAATGAAIPKTVTITAKDYAFEAPDSISAGMVTLKLINNGPSLHHAALMRLTDGKTATDLEQALKSAKPDAPPPTWAHDFAGPNAPAPGGEQSITEQMDAGNYAIICFIPDTAGVPHFMKGMVKALTVVPSTTAAAPAPTADINVTMADYAWQITPDITAGKHIIKLENAAAQSHEMFIAMLPPGKNVADVAKWMVKQVGPPPAKPIGGISAMSKGDIVYLPVDLVPGEYGIFCFIPDAKDGKPHSDHGMLKQITVK